MRPPINDGRPMERVSLTVDKIEWEKAKKRSGNVSDLIRRLIKEYNNGQNARATRQIQKEARH